MTFDYSKPAFKDPFVSEDVRGNFQSLVTQHRGLTPPNSPLNGYTWVDSSDPANIKLKQYENGSFRTILEHLENRPTSTRKEEQLFYFEGNSPATKVDLGDGFGFEDSAGFLPSVNSDIVFKLNPDVRYQNGIAIVLRYVMSNSDAGNLRLRFDYQMYIEGINVTTPAVNSTVLTVDPTNGASEIEDITVFTIPTGAIPDDIYKINCRLTREGVDVLDTHTGIFVLESIAPRILQ